MAEVVKRLGEKMLDGDSVLLIILEIIKITGTDRIQCTVITFFDPPEGWKVAIQLLIGNSLIRIKTG